MQEQKRSRHPPKPTRAARALREAKPPRNTQKKLASEPSRPKLSLPQSKKPKPNTRQPKPQMMPGKKIQAKLPTRGPSGMPKTSAIERASARAMPIAGAEAKPHPAEAASNELLTTPPNDSGAERAARPSAAPGEEGARPRADSEAKHHADTCQTSADLIQSFGRSAGSAGRSKTIANTGVKHPSHACRRGGQSGRGSSSAPAEQSHRQRREGSDSKRATKPRPEANQSRSEPPKRRINSNPR